MSKLICGDCLDVLKTMPDNSVDSIVTDPPYGLSFMGKKWDYDVPSEGIWRECLRVLKPGGHLLSFAGTRTQHRMAVRIEDAGFEIRDMIAWIYGSGFPKSLDVSKEIDKEAGVERAVLGDNPNWRPAKTKGGAGFHKLGKGEADIKITAPATDDAKKWDGWGTALKPALEPITVARKPLSEKTVAANVLKWGTGAINIDGGRVRFENGDTTSCASYAGTGSGNKSRVFGQAVSIVSPPHENGRFPANLIHDGSDEVLELFPETKSGTRNSGMRLGMGYYGGNGGKAEQFAGDSGSAARFFYCAKASKRDRDEGCDGLSEKEKNGRKENGKSVLEVSGAKSRNNHPTVKPTALMRYLCRLVTPPGGVVLDPFMGSGSTGKAARLEGFDFIGIEKDPDYFEIAKARIHV